LGDFDYGYERGWWGADGKELANEAIETTEKILVQTSKFLGGLYKKYKERTKDTK
jgi:hypothetical protein